MFEKGGIFICDGFMYVNESKMYWENNMKILGKGKKNGLWRQSPRQSLLPAPFRLLDNVGNTFSAHIYHSWRRTFLEPISFLEISVVLFLKQQLDWLS